MDTIGSETKRSFSWGSKMSKPNSVVFRIIICRNPFYLRASLKEADEKARPRDNLHCEDFEASIAAAQIPDAFRGPKGDEKARPCEDCEVQASWALAQCSLWCL